MAKTHPDVRQESRSDRVRTQILETASGLFYRNGVRAVGMEQIVAESGIAKTTIYRHFETKDALIEAFLQKEDAEFWAQWDAVVGDASGLEALDRLSLWIGNRVRRDGYRGCPQLNLAAEYADESHPARIVARAHKAEMFRRLSLLCAGQGGTDADEQAMRIALFFDGVFMSGGRLNDRDAPELVRRAVRRLAAP
ncbi:TetR/AcrR family transcriptional regulator [Oceanibaculum indicum]|uniref:TetR family transcriptional regulator n=1 Tax=Oceanibaculum indicum P24 TaxID=1207063 RepID=K2J1Y4_9PROT|nr:TetR/AcrR family transcriptional regulator [Oceanibaculum indicum]EKE76991.1 TetR family transcriptional regulator [Oceanibaculum indicum P24]